MKDYKNLTILIVEDDDGHALLIREGLEESGICNPIIRFSNGEEVWNFLTESKETEYKTKNFLFLLDIKMPKMDGVEVLKRIKENEILKSHPVIMLTTTDDPKEVEQCYQLGCNAYVTKPVDFCKFTETLKRLGLFIQIVKV